MDKIALASNSERKKLFLTVADKTGLSDFVVEKDFWASWILGKIFANESLSRILCFKGGTSLSKAFGLIDRFSEDIDLILSQNTILKEGEQLFQPSNTKQAEFNKEFEQRAVHYITTILKDMLVATLGHICEVIVDKDDRHTLLVKTQKVFNYTDYIAPDIKLEIGPLALWNPNDCYPLSSFVAIALPELKLQSPVIPTIKPERTFWEKITILHHEHYRPDGSQIQPRYSRHYYDVFKISNSSVKASALTNLDLLKEVVEFKKRFYPRGWAKYDEAFPGTLQLKPAKHNLSALELDYTKMQRMFFKNTSVPTWNEILEHLHQLENEINNLVVK
jgi:predicted nucleotidyltransferase component of viral defense system